MISATALAIAGFCGFSASAAVQTPGGIIGIKLTGALLPALGLFAAAMIIWNYSLTRARVAQAQADPAVGRLRRDHRAPGQDLDLAFDPWAQPPRSRRPQNPVGRAPAQVRRAGVVKQRMVRAASKCVVVADSSKLGRIELVPICGIADIDLLVTGEKADPGQVLALREQGLTVELAAETM